MGGGETWITEAKTTVFHNFWKQKLLTSKESVDDFREVTNAEKTQMEKTAEQWQRPPQYMIDRWNTVFGQYGKYNEETGYFEGNTLMDITTEQAMIILERSIIDSQFMSSRFSLNATGENAPTFRTNVPLQIYSTQATQSLSLCLGNHFIEVLNLNSVNKSIYSLFFQKREAGDFIRNCNRLRKVMGEIYIGSINTNLGSGFLASLSQLEEINISGLRSEHNLALSTSPKLNYTSFQYLVKNVSANVTSAKTATVLVHANVYSALSGEAEYPFNGGTREQWEQLLSDAAEKNIKFTT